MSQMTVSSSINTIRDIMAQLTSSVATKLILAMIIVTLLPLALLGVVTNITSANALREQAGESFADHAERTATQIGQALVENVRLIETLANIEPLYVRIDEANASYSGSDSDIQNQILQLDAQWIDAPDSDPLIQNAISDDDEINFIAHQLRDFQQQFPRHVELFATDRYGALIGSTDRTSDYYQADEGWWQAAWNNGNGAVFIDEPEFDESTQTTAVNIAVPIRNSQGQLIGVLRTTLDIQEILDIVAGATFGETGHLTVFNGEGVAIFDAVNPEHVGEILPDSLKAAGVMEATESSWVRAAGEDDEDAVHGYAKVTSVSKLPAVEGLRWTAIATIDSQEALQPIANAQRNAIIIGLASIILAAILAFFFTRQLLGQVNKITELFQSIRRGDYHARVPVLTQDELGRMAGNLNTMLDDTLNLIQTREERDNIEAAIMRLLDEVSGVAEGDLTARAEVTDDLTGAIADSFNMMITELRAIIQNVQQATLQVSSSANEIQATAEHLAYGSESQASQIIDTSAAIDEMSVSIQQVSENATTSATVSRQALNNAQRGTRAVQNTISGMQRIQEQVQETAKRIRRLGESSEEIGKIVELIEDIADNTAILALNASIQASMAGEAGSGFAVVAEEVEQLAEQATEATKQIGSLIRTIQSETLEAVQAMEITTQEVVSGSQLANEAGSALTEIETVSRQLSELIQSISLASQQQARGSETLARAMSEIAEVTQQTAAGTKQAAVSINNLTLLADELRGSVSRFRLSGGNGTNGRSLAA